MENKCLIISGGNKSVIPDENEFDFIIACDKGFEYAAENGIAPDLIIGDFDSSEMPLTEAELEAYPVLKDDTDTMLAIKAALEKGYSDITICCALGGRFDHVFANVQSGAFICENGGRCEIISDDTKMYFFSNGSMVFPKLEGWSFSVFSVSDLSECVSISGCKFNAEEIDITNSFPIGVSNVWEDDTATVSCQNGTLLVIESKLRPKEHI